MEPREVVLRWIDAFNRGDLEGVLELYDDAVKTESPLLLKLGREGMADRPGCLEGKAALRDYFARALAAAERPPQFTPVNLLAEGEVVILEYDREAFSGGQPGVAERFVVREGKIAESRVFWSADKIRDSFL